MKRFQILLSIVFLFFENTSVLSAIHKSVDNTDIAREPDDRPLLFATLGGGMAAVDQITGNIIWTLKDEPVVKVPNENDHFVPQFLPDPRHGSLYMFGTHAGQHHVLKKLPFTIPQLVANAPCRSSDGILYTGKKIDTWFMIDPKTGIRKHVLGYDKTHPFDGSKDNTCPIDPKSAIYVARTEYNVLMYDSKHENQRWNVTFFDYSSHTMGQDMTNNYGIVHFTSTSNGRVTSFDRKTGEMVWSHDMQSPIIATYILDRDGLISVPFNTVGDDTMDHIMDDVSAPSDGRGFKHSNIELFPSLYVGEHVHGLYALSSLVDKNTITISTDDSQPLLLEGPTEKDEYGKGSDSTKYHYSIYGRKVNVHYNIKNDENQEASKDYLLLGHYSVPEYAETHLRMLSKLQELSIPVNMIDNNPGINRDLKLIMGPSEGTNEIKWFEIKNASSSEVKLEVDKDKAVIITNNEDDDEELNETKGSTQSVGIQTDYQDEKPLTLKLLYQQLYLWINQQENIGLKFALIILVGVVISMFWYLRNQIREFQQLSQSGSRNSNSSSSNNGQVTAFPEELENGSVKVGKIIFDPEQVLGKGCEGTFVYRGSFENRDVAVKRLLPECFTFADREVALLTESDAHANVVRYFCMEQDKLFRYIALELCAATLQEYVQKKLGEVYNIGSLEILQQATAGLAHLHALDIVHRDIKPHNVLLSVPSNKSPVRAMISDFGLCKKLNIGRNSFSRRSGVTGTDGWIAPEMIKGERTTTSVDLFSLGCVFYYVLSNGIHPFGDVLERQAKILKGRYNLSHLVTAMPEEEVDLTKCLLKSMLSSRPSERPTATVVHNYPIFWNKQKILAFLQDVSDRVEKDPPGGPLEVGAIAVVRGDWRGRVGSAVAADLRRYRSYSGDSVKDLLRAMRNKKHHYRELTKDAQESLGAIPEGFTLYWITRFPRLLLHTWLQMQIFKFENIFSLYYDQAYNFNPNYIIQEIEFNEFSKYETEVKMENNHLFIKSKNYYDSPKHLKYKNEEPIRYPNANIVEDWRASPRSENIQYQELHNHDVDNFPRQSPVRNGNAQKRDNSRFRDEGKKERRKFSKENQSLLTNTDKLNADISILQKGIDKSTTNRVRNRKKKEEMPIVWVLPNQSNIESVNTDPPT